MTSPPMEIDEILSSLIDLQIISQDIPTSYEFRFNLLDAKYKSNADDISSRTRSLFSRLCSFILSEEVDASDESMPPNLSRAVNALLNSKEMRCLDRIPKPQIAACAYETLERNGVKFFYSQSVPKPPKPPAAPDAPPRVPCLSSAPEFVFTEPPARGSVHPITIDDSAQLRNFVEITKRNVYEELYIAFLGHRVRTYRSFPCLLLVMSRDYEVLVFDLFKLQSDIGTLRDFLNNSPNPKVMFNSRETIQMVAESYGFYMSNLICVGDSGSPLESLLLQFNLSPVVVDWRIRPLSQELLQIAVDQVWYLPHLLKEAGNSGTPVVLNNYEVMPCVPYIFNESEINSTLQTILSLSRTEITEKQITILTELIKLRDSIALFEDESPNFIVKDSTLLKIALTERPDEALVLQNMGSGASPYILAYVSDVLLILRRNLNDEDTQLLFE